MAEIEFVNCDCCGLTEECTLDYIASVREKFEGRWLCGLCSEAVNDETVRSKKNITNNEAMDRHMKFHEQFKSSSSNANPMVELISMIRHLLRKNVKSSKKNELSLSLSPLFFGSKNRFSSLSNEKD